MNRNRARRCLTGISDLYVSQTWTGTPYWLVRTRLWRQADLTLPARIEVESRTKTRLQAVAEQYGSPSIPAQLDYHRAWTSPWTNLPVEVVRPANRSWTRVAVNPSWFAGVQEIVSATADVWMLRVNLNANSVVWHHGDEMVAVLMGLHVEPQRVESEAS